MQTAIALLSYEERLRERLPANLKFISATAADSYQLFFQ